MCYGMTPAVRAPVMGTRQAPDERVRRAGARAAASRQTQLGPRAPGSKSAPLPRAAGLLIKRRRLRRNMFLVKESLMRRVESSVSQAPSRSQSVFVATFIHHLTVETPRLGNLK